MLKKSHSDGTFLYFPDVRCSVLLAWDSPPSTRMEGSSGRKFKSCTTEIPISTFVAVYSASHDSLNIGTLLYCFDVRQFRKPDGRRRMTFRGYDGAGRAVSKLGMLNHIP